MGVKDTDGLAEIFQVPLDGSETVPQLVGAPVQLITADLRWQKGFGLLIHVWKEKLNQANCSELKVELVFSQSRQWMLTDANQAKML